MADCEHMAEMLSACHDGELDAIDVARVERHLAECPQCRELKDRLPALDFMVLRYSLSPDPGLSLSGPSISKPSVLEPSFPGPANPNLPIQQRSSPEAPKHEFSFPEVPNHELSNPEVPNHELPNPQLSNPEVPNHELPNPQLPNPQRPNPQLLAKIEQTFAPAPAGRGLRRLISLATAALVLIAVSLVLIVTGDRAEARRAAARCMDSLATMSDRVLETQDAMLKTMEWDLNAMKLMVGCSEMEAAKAKPLVDRIDGLLREVERMQKKDDPGTHEDKTKGDMK